MGRDAYGSLLSEQSGVWAESAERYGLGAGYKRDAAGIWRQWFETSGAAHATAQVANDRLQDAWLHWVIDPLRKSMRVEDGV